MGNVSKNQRKYGRNAAFCKAYKLTNRREKNKIKNLKKHLINFPDDTSAMVAIDKCNILIRGY